MGCPKITYRNETEPPFCGVWKRGEGEKEIKDLYDYGARMYDPWLGRFPTHDRFAEKYFSLSPYGYAANNPLKYIDHNGDSLVAVTLRGLSSQDPKLRDRQFLVDSEIAENLVGFAGAAMSRFSALSVNNVFRANSSSSIKTSNTKAKGLSRHQAGFAVDFNGVKTLNDDELKELNEIAAEFGFNPLDNQKSDLPHFSIDPTSEGFESLSSAVDENKGHFDQLVNSASEGGIKTSALKNKKGDVIGVRFERGTNDAKSQEQFKKLIDELVNNAQ